jgi:hypothetical protein
MASGCVLSDPPEYGTVKQTPPFLQLDKADPSPYQVTTLNVNEVEPISVAVRSEDAGDPLSATLYLDYVPSPNAAVTELTSREVAASVLEDDTREISISWTPQEAGCRQLTMVVTHKKNLTKDTNRPIDLTDVAYVTWWYLIIDPAENEPTPTIDECGPKAVTN